MAFVRGKRRPALRGEIDDLREAIDLNKRFARLLTKLKVGKLDDADYTAADVLAKLLTVDGTGSGLDADTVDGVHVAGVNYTPTGTGVTNLDSVTPLEANYIRAGSSVMVSALVVVDPTAAASTLTEFRLSLPIASNFTANGRLSGVGVGQGFYTPATIQADTTNHAALVQFLSPTTGSMSMRLNFGYRIV